MAYFDGRLKELHRQKLQKKRLQAMELELERQRAEAAKKAAELNEIKKKEQADVDKLEGKSIKALFATWLEARKKNFHRNVRKLMLQP